MSRRNNLWLSYVSIKRATGPDKSVQVICSSFELTKQVGCFEAVKIVCELNYVAV